jgi:hypothetical protein
MVMRPASGEADARRPSTCRGICAVPPRGGSRTRLVLVGAARGGGDEKRSIAVSLVGLVHRAQRDQATHQPPGECEVLGKTPAVAQCFPILGTRYSLDQMHHFSVIIGYRREMGIERQLHHGNCAWTSRTYCAKRGTVKSICPRLGLQMSSLPISSSRTADAPPMLE